MNSNSLVPAAAAAILALSEGAFAHTDGKPQGKPEAFDAAKVEATAFGQEGDPKKAARTIRVDMFDAMRFSPADITVKRGETVRIVAANKGRVLHEMVIGTPAELREHAEQMRKFPGMEHSASHMTHVKPGTSGEIVWQFTQAGKFQFACLIPGHFEAGMVGKVTVE